jgi:hypothetical protein
VEADPADKIAFAELKNAEGLLSTLTEKAKAGQSFHCLASETVRWAGLVKEGRKKVSICDCLA